jgi:glycosyltransferase involved in cell wall biosynthesis
VNGLVVAPDSPEAIAGGVRRLLEDEALRNRMGAAAAERFREHFELRVTASRFSRLYEDLLDGHSAGLPVPA